MKEKELEKDVQARIMTYLKTTSGHFFKVAQGPFSKKGVSDIIGVHNGMFIAIEVKVAPNKATALQNYFISKIIGAGGVGVVVYSVNDVRELIRKIDNKVYILST